jgi:hypothetical protein
MTMRPIVGVTYNASDMVGRRHVVLAFGGYPVWMGPLAEVPAGTRFDHITMHRDDIAEMEEAARAR